jgi:MATE family multidrug resistance protein
MKSEEGVASAGAVRPPRLATLASLAWPIVLARSTQAVVGLSDAAMTAPLGEAPLAAVTMGAINVLLFVMLPMGTVFILQSFTAQARGKGDLAGVRRYLRYGMALAALAGATALACAPLLDAALARFGYEPAVRDLLGEYLRIRLVSVAAIIGVEAFSNWYGGLGNTRVSLWAGVITMAANVVFNYLLIEPRCGLPGYGVAGAAWASTAASWLAFGALAALYRRGYGHEAPPGDASFRTEEFKGVLRFGLPSGFNWFLEFGAFALFINVVVAGLGTAVLAAFNVVLNLNAVSFMPAFGAASAGAILVGECIGARRFDHAERAVRLTLGATAVWMAAVGACCVLFPERLIGLFARDDAESARLADAGVEMLRYCGLWQLFDAAAMTYAEALRAAGDTKWPMTARLVLAWCGFLPAATAAVRVFDGGVPAIMIALIAYLGLLAFVLRRRFRSGRWKEIDLFRGENSAAP